VDHKDIFVEADYMASVTHTHDPRKLPNGTTMSTSAIAPVIAAFASAPVSNPDSTTGINLHVLLDESLTEQTPISFEGSPSDFSQIKMGTSGDACSDGHFGTTTDRSSMNCDNIIKAKRRVYHYCIFAHDYDEAIHSTGDAEPSGNDFVITFAVQDAGQDYQDLATTTSAAFGTAFETEWRDMVSGALMHELGHNLGLHHGGGNGLSSQISLDSNCKPNYLSVMNYSRQSNAAGTAPGTSSPKIRTNRALDYSRSALATLTEGTLVESSGIGGPAGSLIVYGEDDSGTPRVVAADGSIDWDGQGGIGMSAVSADVTYIDTISSCNVHTPGEVLEGHDDWSNLVYNFRMSPFYANGVTLLSKTHEPTHEDISGAVLGTKPPAVTITSPVDGTRVSAGSSIPIAATASDSDGSVASVYIRGDGQLLSTQTMTPYSYTWSNPGTGTHVISVAAKDNAGATASRFVTVHVGCSASFTPSSGILTSEPASGTVGLSISPGCRWAARTDSAWLAVSPASGVGNAQLTYTALDNPSAQSRSATITVAAQTFTVTQDGKPAFGAPTGVIATGDANTTTPFINVTWHGTAGVFYYEVALSSNGSSYTTVGTTTDQFLTFSTNVSANSAYLVKVRGVTGAGAPSNYSSADLATTFKFTDDPIQPGLTVAKSVHWTELRTAINAVRQLAGLTAASWAADVSVGQPITHVGIEEMRTALNAARSALALSTFSYTDNPLTTSTTIRAVHITELRAGAE